VTKGKEDDKVYRGLNYYNQYIEKKESLIGTGCGYQHRTVQVDKNVSRGCVGAS
jgi:hypothetical protein